MWHACKYEVHELHQRYIVCFYNRLISLLICVKTQQPDCIGLFHSVSVKNILFSLPVLDMEVIIIIEVFLKRKILPLETILSA